MEGRQALMLGIAAAVAGIAWGYLRHRRDGRAGAFALLQGIEWFVAVGGAAALIDMVRDALEEDADLEVTERIMHTRETVADHVGEALPG